MLDKQFAIELPRPIVWLKHRCTQVTLGRSKQMSREGSIINLSVKPDVQTEGEDDDEEESPRACLLAVLTIIILLSKHTFYRF